MSSLTAPRSTKALWLMFLLLSIVFTCGWWFTESITSYKSDRAKNELNVLAATAASALQYESVANLNGRVEESGTPYFERIRTTLKRIHDANPDTRFVYLIAQRGDKIIFLADGEPSTSPDYSSPGDIFKDAPQAVFRIFATGIPLAVGPYKDQWGEWVTGFAPVRDPASGKPIAILGIDISSTKWLAEIAPFRWLGVVITILFACLVSLFGCGGYVQYRSKLRFMGLNDELENELAERRRAEEELRKSEYHVRQVLAELELQGMVAQAQKEFTENLLQHSAVPTFVIDDRHRVLIWNKSCEELTGVKAAEILGTDNHWQPFYDRKRPVLADFVVSGDLEGLSSFYENFARSPLTPDGVRSEGWYLAINCCNRYIFFDATPVRTQDGQIIAAIETLQDLTEWKRAEEKVARARDEWTRTFDAVPDLIAIIDGEHRILQVNRAMAAALGVQPHEAVGRYCFECVHGTDAPPDFCPHSLLLQDHREHSTEVLERRLGGHFHVTVTPLHDDQDAFVGSVHVARDINDRVLAEAALRASEEKHRTILHTAMDGFWLADTEGRLLEVNATYCRMSGYSAQELLTMRIPDLDTCETAENTVTRIQKIMAQGEDRFESRHRRKDGSIFDVEISVQFRPADGGQLVVFLQDITDRKLSEDENAKLKAQLQQAQKMESVGRLAGGVAHDFNNMLCVILVHAELAQAKLDPTQQLYADLTEIRNAAKRSADLTRQLLAFARKQIVVPKVLNLNVAVAGMLKMLHRLIGEDIQLTWQPKGDLWPVKIDPSQIDQILANLCINARDAITGVGMLTIETGNAVIDAAACAGHIDCVPGEYVLLTIRDTGCGMDQETVNQIFEPFFTTNEIAKGTGLGLATVYGIVRQNNGFIDVSSEPGQGTTFRIYLPRHAAPAVGTRTSLTAEIPTGRGEIVLLVEDEPALMKMVKNILELQGYTALAASTPGEAIRLSGEHDGVIHLLLTDVVLPGMNGRDLAERIRSTRPALKCLFMSGYTADVIAHQDVLDEQVQFIQKPFSREELATKIRAVLDNSDSVTMEPLA